MVTPWEMAGFLALLFMMSSCVCVTFPYGILGQVWYLIVSIPDFCLLLYFALFELMLYVSINLAGTCTTCKQRIVCLAKDIQHGASGEAQTRDSILCQTLYQ